MANVVAQTYLGYDIDLKKIAEASDNLEYNENEFPGIITRLANPKSIVILFSNGRIVSTGAKSVELAKQAIERVSGEIKGLQNMEMGEENNEEDREDDREEKKEENEGQVEIKNIVATLDTRRRFSLEKVAESFEDIETEYNPDEFSGLVCHFEEPSGTLLVFSSGRLVVTDINNMEDVEKLVDKAVSHLQREGF